MIATAPALSHRLRKRLDQLTVRADKLCETAESRSLSVDEQSTLNGLLVDIDVLGASLRTIDPPEAAPSPPRISVRSEPLTYRPDGEHSFFADLVEEKTRRWDRDGAGRLKRHRSEMTVELIRRDQAARAAAQAAGLEYRVNPNRTSGQGGSFAPPLWLIERFASVPRAGRPLGNLAPSLPLPPNAGSVSIPKITTGLAVASQTIDGGTVTSVDLTDAALTSTVATIVGQSDASLQLLEQSAAGASYDEIVYAELLQDYDAKLETQLWTGTNTNGTVQGVLTQSPAIGSVTYTDATPTGPKLIGPIAQAAAYVGNTRKLPAEYAFMAPRRWYWLASQLDNNNRPLVDLGEGDIVDLDAPPSSPAMRPAGPLLGVLPVLMVPALLTAVSAAEAIAVGNPSDTLLLEADPVVQVLTDVLSGTLQVRINLRRYVVFFPNRYPSGWCQVTGSGLASPANF